MKIVIDFDGTVVRQDREYDDLETPLELLPGVRNALDSLKRAGHILILSSGRANRALRHDWKLNPGWRSGALRFNAEWWERNRDLNQQRYEQMLRFVAEQLPGFFHYVDDGTQGKVSGDIYIDDKALNVSVTWAVIEGIYGEDEDGQAEATDEG